jgi:hypothetical protein
VSSRHFVGSCPGRSLLHFWVRAGSIYFVAILVSEALLCHSPCETNRYHIIHVHHECIQFYFARFFTDVFPNFNTST